jgi:hypothetical protein
MTRGKSNPRGAGPPARRMTTTLYDLITAVNDSIAPGDDELVARVVTGLLRRNRAKYSRRVFGAPAESETSAPTKSDVPSGSRPKVLPLPVIRQGKA